MSPLGGTEGGLTQRREKEIKSIEMESGGCIETEGESGGDGGRSVPIRGWGRRRVGEGRKIGRAHV